MCRRSGGDGFVAFTSLLRVDNGSILATYWIIPKSYVLGEGKQALPTMSLNANLAANIGMLARVET
jgi:hypothetical protein